MPAAPDVGAFLGPWCIFSKGLSMVTKFVGYYIAKGDSYGGGEYVRTVFV